MAWFTPQQENATRLNQEDLPTSPITPWVLTEIRTILKTRVPAGSNKRYVLFSNFAVNRMSAADAGKLNLIINFPSLASYHKELRSEIYSKFSKFTVEEKIIPLLRKKSQNENVKDFLIKYEPGKLKSSPLEAQNEKRRKDQEYRTQQSLTDKPTLPTSEPELNGIGSYTTNSNDFTNKSKAKLELFFLSFSEESYRALIKARCSENLKLLVRLNEFYDELSVKAASWQGQLIEFGGAIKFPTYIDQKAFDEIEELLYGVLRNANNNQLDVAARWNTIASNNIVICFKRLEEYYNAMQGHLSYMVNVLSVVKIISFAIMDSISLGTAKLARAGAFIVLRSLWEQAVEIQYNQRKSFSPSEIIVSAAHSILLGKVTTLFSNALVARFGATAMNNFKGSAVQFLLNNFITGLSTTIEEIINGSESYDDFLEKLYKNTVAPKNFIPNLVGTIVSGPHVNDFFAKDSPKQRNTQDGAVTASATKSERLTSQANKGLGESLIKPKHRLGINADVAVQEHRHKAKYRLGPGTSVESAHLLNSSSAKNIAAYVRDKALTILLPKKLHAEFDSYWKNWARERKKNTPPGENTDVTVAQWEAVLNDAIDSVPGLKGRTGDTMSFILRTELYQTLGLKATDMLPLPYVR